MFKVCFNLCKFLLVVASVVTHSKCESELKVEDLPEHEINPDYTLIDDMILAPEQYDILFNHASRRVGYKQAVRMWPNATVPFVLDNNFTAAEKSLIRAAQSIIQKASCVQFHRLHEPHDRTDFVHIKPGHGCASTVGFWGGEQIVYLQKVGCMDMGRILHELIHVLGFFHMHTAPDRDEFVEVKWENIIPSTVVNFVVYESEVSMYGTKYDFESITHYPTSAFSSNGKPTLVAREPGGNAIMGQRNHLSEGDVKRLNAMYNCA